MAVKETKLLFHILSNFISNLNDEQITNLINGTAKITYQELNNKDKRDVLQKASSIKEVEQTFNGMLKTEIVTFCRSQGIKVKNRDTKKELFQKIASFYNIKMEENHLNEVILNLQQMNSLEEGRVFLSRHELIKTKQDLIQLAKSLDVHVQPKLRKNELLERIIKSVIGSKLRVKMIQGT